MKPTHPLPFWTLLVSLSPAAALAAVAPTRTEFAVIFQPPQAGEVTMSPDGRRVVLNVPAGRQPRLTVVELDPPYRRTVLPATGVQGLAWVSEGVLAYTTRTELRVVGVDGKADRKLVNDDDLAYYAPSPDGGVRKILRPPQLLPRHLGGVPGRLLVSANGGGMLDIYAIDPANGQKERIDGDPTLSGRLLTDRSGRLRMGEGAAEVPVPTGGIALFAQTFDYLPDRGIIPHNLDEVLKQPDKFRSKHDIEDYYRPRSVPIGFGPDPEVLYVASNLGRDTYGIYAWNVATRTQLNFALEDPERDLADPEQCYAADILIFDGPRLLGVRLPESAGTFWADPGMARLQAAAETKFPGRVVHLLEWTPARQRLLLRVDGTADVGRFFVWDRAGPERLVEVSRRGEAIAMRAGNPTQNFVLRSPDGFPLRGSLTLPRQSAGALPPLVMFCRNIPEVVGPTASTRVSMIGRAPEGLSSAVLMARDIQAIAAMGFAVLQVDYRGSAGYGQKFLHAAAAGFDTGPIGDLRTALGWVVRTGKVDTRRIALVGEGFGGYVALRTLELYPGDFTCGVAINAPAAPASWIYQGTDNNPVARIAQRREYFKASRADLGDISALAHTDLIKRPVMIVQDANNPFIVRSQGLDLRNRLRKAGVTVEYHENAFRFDAALGAQRGGVFVEIAGFLNEHIFDSKVEIGDLKVLDE